ncbi:hypothetical protein K0651_04070 [Ornithinimicrobium sp. Arc0846-15]|nr:hypothetical protein [Ornithinimicrobium laminariae]
MSANLADSKTWWVAKPWLRKSLVGFFAVAFLWLAFLVFVLVFVADDVPWGMMVSAIINPIVAACVWTTVRQRTHGDINGLVIAGPLQSRHIGWAEVASTEAPASRWETPQVQAKLVDGTAVALPDASVLDASDLESMKNNGREEI